MCYYLLFKQQCRFLHVLVLCQNYKYETAKIFFQSVTEQGFCYTPHVYDNL